MHHPSTFLALLLLPAMLTYTAPSASLRLPFACRARMLPPRLMLFCYIGTSYASSRSLHIITAIRAHMPPPPLLTVPLRRAVLTVAAAASLRRAGYDHGPSLWHGDLGLAAAS
jgi:hypothetical protein